MTFKTTIYRDVPGDNQAEDEIELVVDYDYTAGMRAPRERGTGLALGPDDEPELEIEEVRRVDGQEIELTDAEMAGIEDMAWEDVEKQMERHE